VKNRFNERKPFDVVRAEDFGGDLYEFYEPLENLVRKVTGVDIAGSRPVFLIGGRGTGKTMVLKFLSLEMQLNDFIRNTLCEDILCKVELTSEEMKEFLKKISYIGIYSRFRTTEYDQFKGEIAPLFKSYLAIKIGEQIFDFLRSLKASGLVTKKQESEITEFFFEQIKEPESNGDYSFDYALNLIRNKIIQQFDTIVEKSAYCSLDEIKRDYYIPVIISKKVVFNLPNLIFRTIDALRGKNLFILLDELEYLNDNQTRHIGELVKDSDETSVIFKIGARYLPETIFVGESDQVLQEPHDFRVIKIADSLNAAHSGKKFDYTRLIKKILNKRLEKSNYFASKGITRIEQLFPNQSIEEEALLLVKDRKKHWRIFKNYLRTHDKSEKDINKIIDCLKYPENPIIEKLNMLLYRRGRIPQEIKKMSIEFLRKENEEYSRLYEKNAFNLLFQLYSDYRSSKKYAGIDVFINLSSGIIRSAIEICNQALNKAYNYGYEPNQENPVEVVFQDFGARHHARLQFDDILRIPNNLGLPVQEFIKQIGTIFRALHKDRRLVEPEPTHFETDYSEITGRAKEVFDAAIKYSYLQKKPPMDPKSINETQKNDFLTNRVFAPQFEISYRLRGRTPISPSQIDRLITGDSVRKRQTRREILRNTRAKRKRTISDSQKELFDI